MAAIDVEHLTVVRGGYRALDDVSFTVAERSVTGLLGPSGSGKSTLMRSIVGVQLITSGSVRVLGLPAGSAPLRARVGYRTQAPAIYGDLTVAENLRYFARVLGTPPGRVADVVGLVDLRGHEGQLVSSLSGGETARVSLAVALLGKPELLVLDEPTVGLDPVLRRDLWQTFRTLAEEGATLLVSSHVMEEAERCDELLLIREGRLIAAEPPATLKQRTGAPNLDEAFLRLVEQAA